MKTFFGILLIVAMACVLVTVTWSIFYIGGDSIKTLPGILLMASMVSVLVSLTCSIYAQYQYLRGGGSLFGFGLARYYYGELRRTKPLAFIGSLGGIVLAFILMGIVFLIRH